MNTANYLALLRKIKNVTDYRIGKDYKINQGVVSSYNTGRLTLSKKHAFIFARELGIDPQVVIAEVELEHAKNKGKKEDIEFWQEQLNYYANETYALPNGQKVTHRDGEFILC